MIAAIQTNTGSWYHVGTARRGARKIVEIREEPFGVRIIREGARTGTLIPHSDISRIKRTDDLPPGFIEELGAVPMSEW